MDQLDAYRRALMQPDTFRDLKAVVAGGAALDTLTALALIAEIERLHTLLAYGNNAYGVCPVCRASLASSPWN